MEDTLRINLQVEGSDFHQKMKDAKDDVKGVGKSTDQLSSSLGKLSPTFSKLSASMKSAFSSMKSGMADVKGSMASLKTGASGMAGIASSAKSLVSTLGSVLPIIAAVVAAIMALQKVWEFLKKAFKAWDPVGYAKTFGTLQREIRKLMTALGALTSDAVKEIMYVVIGIVRWLRQGVEILVKVKSWVDGILDVLGPIWEIVVNTFSLLGGGFGTIFKFASKTGKEAAEEVGEVWSEEMSVGLASFDKLNNIGMETGDAEERESLLNDMETATIEGQNFLEQMMEGFSGLLDLLAGIGDFFGEAWNGFTQWIGGISNSLGKLWGDFSDWAGESWAYISKTAGDAWRIISTLAGNLWDRFTKTAGDAWNIVATLAGNIWSNFTKTAGETWAKISATAKDVWATISSTAGKIWTDFKKFGTEAWNSISSTAKTILDGIGNLFGPLWDKFTSLATAAVRVFQDIFTSAINAIKSLIDSLISGLQSALNGILDGIGDVGGKLKDAAVSTATTTIKNVDKATGGGATKAIGTWTNIVNGAKEFIENSTRTTKGTGTTVNDFISGVGQVLSGDLSGVQNGIKEFVSDPIKGIQNLFGFAKGGLFEPNHPQLAIFGDNKTEPEVAAPYSMIVSAVTEAMSNIGIGQVGGMDNSGKPLDITLEIDGKKLARVTYDNYENERIRRNGSGAY